MVIFDNNPPLPARTPRVVCYKIADFRHPAPDADQRDVRRLSQIAFTAPTWPILA